MKTWTYSKQVNTFNLQYELIKAGFNVLGITYNEGDNSVIIYLDDAETKDPTSIVNSHIYTEKKHVDWKTEYSLAGNTNQRIEVIAKMLGLIDISLDEMHGLMNK